MMQAQDFPLVSHSPKRWTEFIRARTPILESIVQLDSQGRKNWKAMTNDTVLAHTIWKIRDESIGGRKELAKADKGLYRVLGKRKLLDSVGLEEKQRDWTAMGDDELFAFAKGFITENGIGGRAELVKADSGLYDVLWRRKLLDSVGLEDSRGERRDWAAMRDDELFAFAKGFITENGIWGRKELEKADKGLYRALSKRKLLNTVGLGHLRRELRGWAEMGNEELVAFAKGFIASTGIGGRKELEKVDAGLYAVLRRRKLQEDVFSKADSTRHADAVAGVLDALESFGDEK